MSPLLFGLNTIISQDVIGRNIFVTENDRRHRHFGISRMLRIFFFETDNHNFSIDFVSQDAVSNAMYIVPSGHNHFISPYSCSNYLCIEISNSYLEAEDVNLIWAIKYQKQKLLFGRSDDIIHYDVLKGLVNSSFKEDALFQLLRNNVLTRIQFRFGTIPEVSSKYLSLAGQFLRLIENDPTFTVQKTMVFDYAERLQCSEKALLRCCLSVFNTSPQEILKYHLLMKALGLMNDFRKPVSNIANRLGYSSQSAFSKFIKCQTNQSPSLIRQQLKDYDITV